MCIYTHERESEKSINLLHSQSLPLGRLADEIDEDKSGTLEEEELKAFLEKLEIKANYQEVRVLFARLDYTGNGSLTYHEFMDRLNNWKKNAKQSNKAPKGKVSLPVSQIHSFSAYKPSRRSDEFVCESRVRTSHEGAIR